MMWHIAMMRGKFDSSPQDVGDVEANSEQEAISSALYHWSHNLRNSESYFIATEIDDEPS